MSKYRWQDLTPLAEKTLAKKRGWKKRGFMWYYGGKPKNTRAVYRSLKRGSKVTPKLSRRQIFGKYWKSFMVFEGCFYDREATTQAGRKDCIMYELRGTMWTSGTTEKSHGVYHERLHNEMWEIWNKLIDFPDGGYSTPNSYLDPQIMKKEEKPSTDVTITDKEDIDKIKKAGAKHPTHRYYEILLDGEDFDEWCECWHNEKLKKCKLEVKKK